MSAGPDLRDTFVQPHRTPSHRSWTRGFSDELPPDLLERTRERLRVAAFLYSIVFFVVGWAPALIFNPAPFSEHPAHWLPGAISIPFGLVVGALTFRRGIPPSVLGVLGRVFLVASSFGIAFAEYQGITAGLMRGDEGSSGLGLSWVAPWVVLFNVVVPSTPRRELPATLAAVASVPIAYAVGVAGGSNVPISGLEFILALVSPYIMIAVMAHAGARVVFRLGADVKQAREMGSYRLVERLGQGGMGEVWRAEHRLLARPAAIKLIRPEMLGGDAAMRERALARFKREAQATACMRCPHTIELYDFGIAADGAFYYVMELLEGFDLETLVETHGPLPAARAVPLLRQVCHSLAEAHDCGLIHRDIKPANVFVCRYGIEVDWVKLLDFGLVKHERVADREDVKLTAEDAVGGTPAFMAPEQVLGRPVDGRADLYSVGCVAYWMLTGHLVFEGRNAIETMMHHTSTPPEPPSRRSELPIPAELERIVLDCLAKDPGDRPADAATLSARLAAVPLGGEWSPERARAWWDRHQLGARMTPGGGREESCWCGRPVGTHAHA